MTDPHAHMLAARILAQGLGTTTAHVVCKVVDALLAAGYHRDRTITTRAELDALPPGSVVLIHGVAWQSDDCHWWTHVNHNPYTSHELAVIAYGHIDDPGTITVIHTPQTPNTPHTSPDGQ